MSVCCMLCVCCSLQVEPYLSPCHEIYSKCLLPLDITAIYLSDVMARYLLDITARYLLDITARYLSDITAGYLSDITAG